MNCPFNENPCKDSNNPPQQGEPVSCAVYDRYRKACAFLSISSLLYFKNRAAEKSGAALQQPEQPPPPEDLSF